MRTFSGTVPDMLKSSFTKLNSQSKPAWDLASTIKTHIDNLRDSTFQVKERHGDRFNLVFTHIVDKTWAIKWDILKWERTFKTPYWMNRDEPEFPLRHSILKAEDNINNYADYLWLFDMIAGYIRDTIVALVPIEHELNPFQTAPSLPEVPRIQDVSHVFRTAYQNLQSSHERLTLISRQTNRPVAFKKKCDDIRYVTSVIGDYERFFTDYIHNIGQFGGQLGFFTFVASYNAKLRSCM